MTKPDALEIAIRDELVRQGGYLTERPRGRRFERPGVLAPQGYAEKVVIGDDSDADGVDVQELASALRVAAFDALRAAELKLAKIREVCDETCDMPGPVLNILDGLDGDNWRD